MIADYHVHTDYSDDSVYPMEKVVTDAIRKGIDEICFTDHVDYGIKSDWGCEKTIKYRDGKPLMNVNYRYYMEEIKEMQYLYGSQIEIKAGLEFGMQVHTIPQYEQLFRKYNFDFIILSVHQVDDREFWSQDFQRGKTQQEYNERYYDEMLKLVKLYKNYSVLGHMDLIARYDQAGIYPFEKIKPFVEEILKIVIADGKGIELNTSWRRYGLEHTTPSENILELYRDLGGEIITLGSDSHAPEHLGMYIEEDKKLLRAMGFRQFCTFSRMKPVFHKL